ncbi:MAG TPA: hypothetical protein ENG80_05505 [Nitrospirae bacterium]|nr:hypothetical protein [Nitrospirota bacterium]
MTMNNEEIKWLESYKEEVSGYYAPLFDGSGIDFKDWDKLLQRFADAVDNVLSGGRQLFSAAYEAHNELCIADAIISNPNPKFIALEYEPPLIDCAQSIDFRAIAEDESAVYVDVKTIKPSPKDRWDQFERAIKERWFPENIEVMMSKEWLGGELWHSKFTARSRMLKYTLELEQKINDSTFTEDNYIFALALCCDGFSWHHDELEDFVHYYYSGSYRFDDPLADVQSRYMDEKGLAFRQTISRFVYVQRSWWDVQHKRINWNVQPPTLPDFKI